MGQVTNILLLAGSAEANQIAKCLIGQGKHVIALLSEAPKGANPMPVPFEMQDFSDAKALAERMRGFHVIVDASHGFDATMTACGYEAAQLCALPFVTLSRPKWRVEESPLWQSAKTITDAMPLVPKGARVFSATGWASLGEFAGFPGAALLLRQTSRHARKPPFGFVTWVFGDPPFRVTDEIELFTNLNVDLLICRNLGGLPSRPKLDAALELGLPVILIDPPAIPDEVPVVDRVDAALAWIDGL